MYIVLEVSQILVLTKFEILQIARVGVNKKKYKNLKWEKRSKSERESRNKKNI